MADAINRGLKKVKKKSNFMGQCWSDSHLFCYCIYKNI